ncbi:laminin subunit alpha-1 [Engraulis encrasicolus]|uniref:laminin subunit alpha-1 n=1 Tax=Engraulis encrasicolus TaxID=184585 RepID=UPI002FD428CD
MTQCEQVFAVVMYGAGGPPHGLFPAILNLASNAEIDANATCGDPHPEMYCKLVEHVPGQRIRNAQCRRCDARSANRKEQHPITNAIDGSNGWWQSPSIKNGRQFHWITITLDLRQVFQVAYVIIKAANSPRPGNWVLERSMDGVDYTPWQYYAISDTECLTRYNITPRLGPPTYKKDDEVICTSYYSRLEPLEHGEIHTSLIIGRPSADDPTPELLEFTSARFIRLRLQRIRTLNADLMTLSHRDPKDVDPIVTRRYYYSLKDISVGGMCICYGHAQSCPLDSVTKKHQCVCEHNTCGESCNECCPGYHQQPWQPGTYRAGNTCEKCNCHNKAEDCYYNATIAELKRSLNIQGLYAGGGVCIDCTQNTAGVNCETCADGYFRPHKVSPYAEEPCEKCNCNMRGSLSPACIRDDKHASPEKGLHPGQCLCKEGFAGERCDRCAFGYRNFPLCTKCECSLEGSLNVDPCEECMCKENVMGAHCDLCRPGFYNLQGSNPEGCTECFCFGVSDVCESLQWPKTQIEFSDGWLVAAAPSTSVYTAPLIEDNLIIPSNVTSYRFLSTWAAPETFLGNRLTSYGGYLKYSVAYDIAIENVDKTLPAHLDFIIEGNGRSLRQSPSRRLLLTPLREEEVAVELVPHSFVDLHTARRVQRDELMMVLADVASLRIRLYLNTSAEGDLRLEQVSLDSANRSSSSEVQAISVEQCECPWGYSGTSCEYCISGFYRVDGILFGGNCLMCECNDHATECDINGVCLGCTHNTTGPHCDQCLPGYYGDPFQGTAEDCQRCACPLTVASNNFSPTCSVENSGEVTCDQCQRGYTGPKCERCDNGYYGDPTVPGQGCVPCQCNGNVDPREPGHCDPSSGECLKCVRHTAGPSCERCADGYFGDAVDARNCQACGCHGNGSLSSVCHGVTGQCACRDHVEGEKCDRCEVGFHGLLSGKGCVTCNCNQSGSTSTVCDEEGRCQCVTGVGGDKCDRCQQGYFNFKDGGCTACDCAHTHGNCNAETGECICPPHTTGEKCELCEDRYWGHDAMTGCKPCECSEAGSSSPQCNLTSGQCPCLDSFEGLRCHHCALGFKGFPQCTACNCNVNGTQEQFCDAALGVCGCEEKGSCTCKENVGGGGCDECKVGTFGLTSENPAGCSPCFCFGVSTECEEMGGLVRIPLTLGPDPERLHVVSQSNLRGSLEGVYVQDGEMLLDPRQLQNASLTGPLYWRLPKHFQGHKLLSYGGKLSYSLVYYAEAAEGLTNYEPQLLIRGGHLKKLVIYIDMPTPHNAVQTRQQVPLTEHKWKYFNSVSEKPVSHSDFMSVLSNIEYIIIKASYGTGLQQSRIANISMEMAMDAEDEPEGTETARLIEMCECPRGYAGLSCQECAPGYYRQPVSELNMKGASRPLIQPCVPCRCNNHSLACDLETGECLGCQHNTAGERCHVCAQGYYGTVRGSISDCSLCACPLQTNSFSPSCVLESVGDYRCTACQAGYEGRYCERCSVGYYGNPSEPGGQCQPCQCSAAGSLSQVCHHLTGKCDCKVGVRGHTCEECEARHVLIQDQCVSCDDECTGVLLDDMDVLDELISSVNLTGMILAPFSLLVSLENQTRDIQVQMSWENSVSHKLNVAELNMTSLTMQISDLEEKANAVSKYGDEVMETSGERIARGNQLLDFINKTHAAIKAVEEEVGRLNESSSEEMSVKDSSALQEEAAAMLHQMRNISLHSANASALTELSNAENVLNKVQKEIGEPRQAIESQLDAVTTALSNQTKRLQEARELIATARDRNNQTTQLVTVINATLEQYTTLKDNVLNETQEVTSQMALAQDLLSDALNIGGDMDNITSTLEETRDELEMRYPMLRKHVDALVMDLTKRDALHSVYRAEDHARTLKKEAEALNRSLSEVWGASANATIAAQANTNIRGDIQRAEDLAMEAVHNATHALNQTQSEEPLSERGRQALQRSIGVLEESYRLSNHSHGLAVNLTDATVRISLVKNNLRNFSQLIPEASSHIKAIPSAGEQVQRSKEQVEGVNLSILKALDRLEDFKVQLEESTSTVAEASSTTRNTNQVVTDSEKTTNEATSKLEEVEVRAERLFDRMKPLKALGENLGRNLSDIKEMISQARRQAASIKVAVLAESDCVRAYKPEVPSSNINTLTLTVKTTEPDNLLFYMGSSSAADFMALEMRHGKVSFLWDAGSGHARLEYPDVHINNNKWQRINATRFGRHGTLSVQQLDSPPMPPVKATAPGQSTIMDVTKDTWIFVGGLGGQVKKSSAVKMTDFKGCMGEASLNERNIGLWNYAEREGLCRGCFKSPQAEETSFHFDGSGYSVVEKSLRPTSTSIVMFFKTLSPNGLLLYLASNATRDFLSIELVDGKVRLTFELGSGPLTMTTTKAYNTGSWFKIALQRNKCKCHMSIMAADNTSDREVTEAEAPGAASDLNRSDLDPIYIGGLPMSRPIRRQVVARSYVGCIKNVEIARTNFDLLRDSYGVKKGCVLEPIRSMSLLGGGFLEMPSLTLDPQMELMATFSTKNNTGLLLAGFGKMANRKRRQAHQPFLAVMLVSGRLEVHVNMAEGGSSHKAVIRSSAGTFADGKEHSVILQRNKRALQVVVDEDHQTSVKLGSSSDKGSLMLENFYMGGVPPGEGSRVLSSTTSFYGCIRNVALDAKLLDLSSALRYEGVDMDSCLLEERPKRVVLPDDPEAEPTPDPPRPPNTPPTELSAITPGSTSCATRDNTATLEDSHQFGLSRSSHMVLSFKNRTVRTSFTVKLSARTFARSGVLFYMANANQQDYAVLQVQGGHLFFSCDLGKGAGIATLPKLINDGLWHTVKATFGKKSVSISVDGEESAQVQVKGHTLDVEGKLYLGGLPVTYNARRIGNVTHSLAGCIQGVLLNSVKLNMNRPLSSHGTGECFSTAQEGTFFNGTGYAAFVKEGYNVGSDMFLSLEFRSTSLDAVLLGVSSAKIDAIGLELINGQVVFHVNNGAGRLSATSRSSRWFCDGRWHTVVAKKFKNSISITVDGITVTTANPYLSSTSAETKNPIYVGGYPADVKQNCLSSRTAFQGCMRNLRVSRGGHMTDSLDFSSAFLLNAVVPNSCPGSTTMA